MSTSEDQVEQVLTTHLAGDPRSREGDMVGDWLLVAHITNPDPELPDRYQHMMARGTIPLHTAYGLNEMSRLELDGLQDIEEDDDAD